MHHSSRRQALKWISAPLLPLGTVSAASVLAGCASGTVPAAAQAQPVKSVRFTSMDAPDLANPAAMARTTVASTMEVLYQDGSLRPYRLSFQPFFMTGDLVPDGKGGRVVAG